MITRGTIEAIIDEKTNAIVMIQLHTHLCDTVCVEQSLN